MSTTHRIILAREAVNPQGDAASMLAEGFLYPADRPSHVEILAPAHLVAQIRRRPLLRLLRRHGAHRASTLTILPREA